MNNLRINNDQEEELFQSNFKVPVNFRVIFIFLCELPLFIVLLYFATYFRRGVYFPFFILLLVITIVSLIYLFFINIVNKCSFKITSKRIIGSKPCWIWKVDFSFRLDTIENVMISKCLGISFLSITSSNNINNRSNKITIPFLDKHDEAYSFLQDLILKVKNDKDLYADLKENEINNLANISSSLSQFNKKIDLYLKNNGIENEETKASEEEESSDEIK